ncbi:pyruvate dehydrogenase (acetyl-transferring), homodimeric type [bacterium]|nr:pyruvate dehydrogenase (acetyl-transferring), homodimeric type [bacterium]
MAQQNGYTEQELFELEKQEWLDSLRYVIAEHGTEKARELLKSLLSTASKSGVRSDFPGSTPYLNTIPLSEQPQYPGDRELERRIKSIVRWNAMAMVVRANRETGVGGHISTFASSATLYEVAQNHFFKGPEHPSGGDIIYFQGHASPGMYARAYLEGRLTEKDLANFRRECNPEGGLSSYPHPWLMPDFWQFPTVSMGLGPLSAIYQARFNRYLEDRGLVKTEGRRVWAFLGDGEMDEPESMGAITLASRENLDNLTFVINCNLQRLDGPVRGNGRVIQELEAAFRGAGWNVVKVILGGDWDPLLEKDERGAIEQRLSNNVDGHAQKYVVMPGNYLREHFFGADPYLLKLVEHLSDNELRHLRKGGHDPVKMFAAYDRALKTKHKPTVILAHTIKGYGLGEAGEGRNVTHQQKKLNEEELREFRSRFAIPLGDKDVPTASFYRPSEDSEEVKYLKKRRKELGGFVPARRDRSNPIPAPEPKFYEEFLQGSGDREVATTMAFVSILSKLLRDKNIGKRVVPIVPDEARTFGMESLFRQVGIYAHKGQLYEPVDSDSLMYYNEKKDGTVLEEGITEAGSMASFIAAGTSYSNHDYPMIPMFIYYSMFGFQRIGDLVWLATDARARGFMLGATAGRTTLMGEGLQHQDGHSHHLAMAYNNVKAYDPAFAYELAVIMQDGLIRMAEKEENLIYYITVMNETYKMPPMPKGSHVREGILNGLYKYDATSSRAKKKKVHLLGSGTILTEALKARDILEEKYKVAVDVWSATSYKELYVNAIDTERKNRLHPTEPAEKNFVEEVLDGEDGVFVAASDYLRSLPLSIAKWIPGRFEVLGTDGFGRSDTRQDLREHFEVNANHIAFAALVTLARDGRIELDVVSKAAKALNINKDKVNPIFA